MGVYNPAGMSASGETVYELMSAADWIGRYFEGFSRQAAGLAFEDIRDRPEYQAAFDRHCRVVMKTIASERFRETDFSRLPIGDARWARRELYLALYNRFCMLRVHPVWILLSIADRVGIALDLSFRTFGRCASVRGLAYYGNSALPPETPYVFEDRRGNSYEVDVGRVPTVLTYGPGKIE